VRCMRNASLSTCNVRLCHGGNYASVYTANGNSSGFSKSRIDCRIGTPKKLWFTTSALTDIAIWCVPFPVLSMESDRYSGYPHPFRTFGIFEMPNEFPCPTRGCHGLEENQGGFGWSTKWTRECKQFTCPGCRAQTKRPFHCPSSLTYGIPSHRQLDPLELPRCARVWK
jgi:hypothetical protein